MDISRFRSSLVGDGARPNLFRVVVNLPPALLATENRTSEVFASRFELLCRAAAVPASTVNKVPVAYQGREVYLAGNRTFADWTVTVLNDEDFSIRRTFELWMAGLNSHVTNVRRADFASATSYTADCIVEHLGKTPDSVIARYKMEHCWPTDLSDIQLDWSNNDQIEEFTVTFSFDDWVDLDEQAVA